MELLQGVVQNYDWGDHHALATLFGRPRSERPEAEYWLGAHPKAPSVVVDSHRDLRELMQQEQGSVLGRDVAERFENEFPFLLKLLAAGHALSIQAHPTKEQAEVGFDREEADGIERLAPNRNYKDRNHKPELICALTPFDAMCGFRPLAETLDLLDVLLATAQPEAPQPKAMTVLRELRERLATTERPATERLAETVAWLLGMDEARITESAITLVARCEQLISTPPWRVDQAELATTVEWTPRLADRYPGDRGLLVALLMNHITLEPGEALFLSAGNLHAYVQGFGVELMANSDNVLRGGLTPKHVDIDELLHVVDYEPGRPPVQRSDDDVHRFETPVPDFGLHRYREASLEGEGVRIPVEGPEILLVTEGSVVVGAADTEVVLTAGDAALIRHSDREYRLLKPTSGCTVWRASVGHLAPS